MQKSIGLINRGENYWEFEYPSLHHDYDEELEIGIDLTYTGQYKKAGKIFRSIIKACPEHIDAYHHLALLYDRMKKPEIAFVLWEKAVSLGKSRLPEGFSIEQNILEWSMLENRPFLRSYNALAISLFEQGETKKALDIFLELLKLNPNDNQGNRAMAVNCYFELNQPEGVLEISKLFPNDAMVDTIYGKILALLQLGRIDKAKKGLKTARKYSPRVVKELLKKKHKIPKGMREDRITMGGHDEAYDYWQRYGKYWERKAGAIDFLRENK